MGDVERDLGRDLGVAVSTDGRSAALRAEPQASQAKPAATNAVFLDTDRARLAVWKAINAIQIGNPTDDKLIVANLARAGVFLAEVFCRWCNDGCGWFTSYSGGFARWVPCEYCNHDGTAKRDPRAETPKDTRHDQ